MVFAKCKERQKPYEELKHCTVFLKSWVNSSDSVTGGQWVLVVVNGIMSRSSPHFPITAQRVNVPTEATTMRHGDGPCGRPEFWIWSLASQKHTNGPCSLFARCNTLSPYTSTL
ncbi:hypothetical protein Hanom_Chr16g01431351 [Helianthus anomalus]